VRRFPLTSVAPRARLRALSSIAFEIQLGETMKLDTVSKCLFALAAVAGACFYGYDVLTRSAQPVYANSSLVGKDGFTINTVKMDANHEYVVVTTYAENPSAPGEMRRVMMFYEVRQENEGKAKLFLVCTRCIEYDGFADAFGYVPKDDNSPKTMKKLFEDAQKAAAESKAKAEEKDRKR
jgi:hypothetical protein